MKYLHIHLCFITKLPITKSLGSTEPNLMEFTAFFMEDSHKNMSSFFSIAPSGNGSDLLDQTRVLPSSGVKVIGLQCFITLSLHTSLSSPRLEKLSWTLHCLLLTWGVDEPWGQTFKHADIELFNGGFHSRLESKAWVYFPLFHESIDSVLPKAY